jgi:hypothetical protein
MNEQERRIVSTVGAAVGSQLREMRHEISEAQAAAMRDLRNRLDASNELQRLRTQYAVEALENFSHQIGRNL